jgi:hypothetical protein
MKNVRPALILVTSLLGISAQAAVTSSDLCVNTADAKTQRARVLSWTPEIGSNHMVTYTVFLDCSKVRPQLKAEVRTIRIDQEDQVEGPVPVQASYDDAQAEMTFSFELKSRWNVRLAFVAEEVTVDEVVRDDDGAPRKKKIEYGKKILFLKNYLNGFDPDSSSLTANGKELELDAMTSFNGKLFFPKGFQLNNIVVEDHEIIFGTQLPYGEVLSAIASL